MTQYLGGELGGEGMPKHLSVGILVLLWMMYVVFYSIHVEGHINGNFLGNAPTVSG